MNAIITRPGRKVGEKTSGEDKKNDEGTTSKMKMKLVDAVEASYEFKLRWIKLSFSLLPGNRFKLSSHSQNARGLSAGAINMPLK